jgi:hypothetical protein
LYLSYAGTVLDFSRSLVTLVLPLHTSTFTSNVLFCLGLPCRINLAQTKVNALMMAIAIRQKWSDDETTSAEN